MMAAMKLLLDCIDYLRLRRHVTGAWRFLADRKKEGGTPVEIALRSGHTVRIPDTRLDRHAFHRIFARDEYRLDRIGADRLGTVIDVGANVGLFALRVAPLAERVLCFEPFPANFELLERNTKHLENVSRFRLAVSNTSGKASFHESVHNVGHSLHADVSRGDGEVAVECVTLHDAMTAHAVSECSLLKLDCEGAEYQILESLPEDAWGRIDRTCMEYHAVPSHPTWTGEYLVGLLERAGHVVDWLPREAQSEGGHIFSFRRAIGRW